MLWHDTKKIPTFDACFDIRFEDYGEVAEWLKAHAWKVCVPQKGTAGSNPALSADFFRNKFLMCKKMMFSIFSYICCSLGFLNLK